MTWPVPDALSLPVAKENYVKHITACNACAMPNVLTALEGIAGNLRAAHTGVAGRQHDGLLT